jgi:hypothetical protein
VVGKRRNYCVNDNHNETNNIDTLAMATPGQETMACEEGERTVNNTMSFAIVIDSGGNGLIPAAQGQWQLITAQGSGAQQAGPINRP